MLLIQIPGLLIALAAMFFAGMQHSRLPGGLFPSVSSIWSPPINIDPTTHDDDDDGSNKSSEYSSVTLKSVSLLPLDHDPNLSCTCKLLQTNCPTALPKLLHTDDNDDSRFAIGYPMLIAAAVACIVLLCFIDRLQGKSRLKKKKQVSKVSQTYKQKKKRKEREKERKK